MTVLLNSFVFPHDVHSCIFWRATDEFSETLALPHALQHTIPLQHLQLVSLRTESTACMCAYAGKRST